MTNDELQRKLDERKWLLSKLKQEDLSGKMPYCAKCKFCIRELYSVGVCTVPQIDREQNRYCARAYKK